MGFLAFECVLSSERYSNLSFESGHMQRPCKRRTFLSVAAVIIIVIVIIVIAQLLLRAVQLSRTRS